MKISVRTETPLWTGGVNSRESDRVHASGIIGNLRWWYEALWRGMGVEVCDPTQNPCKLDGDEFASRLRAGASPDEAARQCGLCPACLMFGATGWSRRFRIVVEDDTHLEPNNRRQPATDDPAKKIFRKNRRQINPLYFFDAGRHGDFGLKIISSQPSFKPDVLLGMLKLIANYASLASKGQLGYGLITLSEAPVIDPATFVRDAFGGLAPSVQADDGLPNLRYMFFAEYDLNENKGLETLTNLKFDVRQAFRTGPASIKNDNPRMTKLRHFILGSTKDSEGPFGSKICFSRVQEGHLRVWGWVPPSVVNAIGASRDEVIECLRTEILDTSKRPGASLVSWREFDSARDSARTNDYLVYLQSLLT